MIWLNGIVSILSALPTNSLTDDVAQGPSIFITSLPPVLNSPSIYPEAASLSHKDVLFSLCAFQ